MSPFDAYMESLVERIREIVREELARARGAVEYLTIQQAAEVAGVHHATVRAWIKERTLPAVRAGRRVRIKRSELDALLARPRAGTPSPDEEVARLLARVDRPARMR